MAAEASKESLELAFLSRISNFLTNTKAAEASKESLELVRDLLVVWRLQEGNLKKTEHLLNFPHANESLTLVKADLLDEGSFDSAVAGCEGVFHTASPVLLQDVTNPEDDLIKPAVNGTLNVLSACAKSKSVKRVVLTSSTAAVEAFAKSGTIVVDESCWSDLEYCKEKSWWYTISKILAEQRAWTFAKENGLDIVSMNPGLILGRPLQKTTDVGTKAVFDILTGQETFFNKEAFSVVDVKDVVDAHILTFENAAASGRYVLVERVIDCPTILEILVKFFPDLKLAQKYVEKPLVPALIFPVSASKAEELLGAKLTPIEDVLADIVHYLLEIGLDNYLK